MIYLFATLHAAPLTNMELANKVFDFIKKYFFDKKNPFKGYSIRTFFLCGIGFIVLNVIKLKNEF